MSERGERVEYDARQRFWDEVMNRINRTALYMDRGDLRSWYLELHGVYTLLSPWMSPSDKKRLKYGEDRGKDADHTQTLRWGFWGVRREVMKSQQLDDGIHAYRRNPLLLKKARDIEQELLVLSEELMNASKHLLLPSGSDTDDEINWDEVLKGT